MQGIFHEVIAAAGGILFLIIGVTRQRERLRLIRAGKAAETNVIWISLTIAGSALLVFAIGLIIYQFGRNAG